MRRLFLKCLLLFFLLLFVDRGIGTSIAKWAQAKSTDRRIGEIFSGKITHDLLIFGSSRAARNIIASEIERTVRLSSYNLGLPGSNIDLHTQLFEFISNRGKMPQVVLLIVDPTELIHDPSINFRYDVLYPYASYEEVRTVLVERKQLDYWLSKFSITYREKHGFLETFRPHKFFVQSIDPLNNIQEDGSIPIEGRSVTYNQMEYMDKTSIYSNSIESPSLRNRFDRFLAICEQHGIKLFVIICPSYAKPVQGFSKRIIDLVGNRGTCLDYSDKHEFLNKDRYFDSVHLNREGALILSRCIGDDMKAILSK